MDIKLDYDEGNWLLTFDGHDTTATIWLNDDEAFHLDELLAPVRARRDEIADMLQLYKGARLAGFTNEDDDA